MNGTTWMTSVPTWRDHVQKGGQAFQPRNAFNHLTKAIQDKRGSNFFLVSTAVLEFFNDILFSHVLNWSDMLAQNTLYP